MVNRTIFNLIDIVIAKIGKVNSWLSLVLILLIFVDVLQRYLFNVTYNWVMELEWQVFGTLFLLGSSHTLQKNKHVRVDVFYQQFTERTQAAIDAFGILFLLMPWSLLCILKCYKYAINSYSINESSPNQGGLPYFYIIKFIMVIGFVLLLLQSISLLVQKLGKIINR